MIKKNSNSRKPHQTSPQCPQFHIHEPAPKALLWLKPIPAVGRAYRAILTVALFRALVSPRDGGSREGGGLTQEASSRVSQR